MLGRLDEEDAEYYGNLGNVSNCLIFYFFNCSYFGNFGNYGNFEKLDFYKITEHFLWVWLCWDDAMKKILNIMVTLVTLVTV